MATAGRVVHFFATLRYFFARYITFSPVVKESTTFFPPLQARKVVFFAQSGKKCIFARSNFLQSRRPSDWRRMLIKIHSDDWKRWFTSAVTVICLARRWDGDRDRVRQRALKILVSDDLPEGNCSPARMRTESCAKERRIKSACMVQTTTTAMLRRDSRGARESMLASAATAMAALAPSGFPLLSFSVSFETRRPLVTDALLYARPTPSHERWGRIFLWQIDERRKNGGVDYTIKFLDRVPLAIKKKSRCADTSILLVLVGTVFAMCVYYVYFSPLSWGGLH